MNQTSELIARFREVINADRQTLIEEVLNQRTRYITIVLEDFYHSYNASAILRTCECLGVQDIHIIEDRNTYQLNKDVLKGASKWLSLHRYNESNEKTRTDCIQQLKQNGYKIAAMSLREDSIELEDLNYEQKTAFCFGTEESGLSDVIHDNADYFIKLPMTGFTQSFNVSVSAGISLSKIMNIIKAGNINWQLPTAEKNELQLDWLIKSTPTGQQLYTHYLEEISAEKV